MTELESKEFVTKGIDELRAQKIADSFDLHRQINANLDYLKISDDLGIQNINHKIMEKLNIVWNYASSVNKDNPKEVIYDILSTLPATPTQESRLESLVHRIQMKELAARYRKMADKIDGNLT